MTVAPRKLLETFKLQTTEIPERVPGYRDELFETIAEIIAAESEHERRKTDILQSITSYCRKLGEYAFNNQEKC